MKAIFVFLVLQLSLVQVACGRADQSRPAHAAGGTTAGGGGVVNPTKLNMADAKTATGAAKSIVMNYLWSYGDDIKVWSTNCESSSNTPHQNDLCTANRKLFLSNPDVFSVIVNLKIDFLTTAPCHDAFGNPVDGSIFGVPKGHICISGQNLTEKLDDFFYEPQIAALVLHEVSHLLGTTESESTALQTELISMLQESSVNDLRQATQQVIYGGEASAFDGTVFVQSCNPDDPDKCMLALCSADEYVGYGARIIMNTWNVDTFRIIPNALRAETLKAMYREVALSDYACSRTVAVAVAQGKTDLIESHQTIVDRALKRVGNLKEKGEIALTDYIDKTNPTQIARIAFDINLPDRLKSISDADFPGLLLDVTEEAKSLAKRFDAELKGQFELIEK